MNRDSEISVAGDGLGSGYSELGGNYCERTA
jgi:hypothetical protein